MRQSLMFVTLAAALLCEAAPVFAQGSGKIGIEKIFVLKTQRVIELQLTRTLPPDARTRIQAPPVSAGWHVMSVEIATGQTQMIPIDSLRIDPTGAGIQLRANPGTEEEWFDTASHSISVTALRGGLGHAVLTPQAAATTGAANRRGLGAAKTAEAADVYFSGKITATDGSEPSFSFEAKLKHAWRLGGNAGAVGYAAEVAAEQQNNADPDRIVVGATYRRVLSSRPNALILHAQPVAGEFTRKAPRTKTLLATAQLEHVLVPSTGQASDKARAAVLVFGGIEAGNNFSNALDKEDGSGGVFRLRLAVHPHVTVKSAGPLKNLKASVLWEARFLAQDEIDPGRLDASQQPMLTDRTRQHLKVDIDFGLTELISLTLQHRQGYLPPLYKKVSPTLTLSLTFKGRWL